MGWYVSIYKSDPQLLKKTTGLIVMKCTRSCFTHLVKKHRPIFHLIFVTLLR